MKRASLKLSIDVELTPAQLAEAFCSLGDEEQAQVFIEAAAIAEKWRESGGSPGMQWHLVGGHLRKCACSTEEAREMVEAIAGGMRS